MKVYPLKRCPFCGGKAKLSNTLLGWTVECYGTDYESGCGINIGFSFTPNEAAAHWNKRYKYCGVV